MKRYSVGMEKSIYALIREVDTNYENETIETVEGLEFSMYEQIRENEFLTSGHYISGDFDENGDLKPFHDIITRILETQRAAEEVDTKDLTLVTDDPALYVRANLLSKYNQDWITGGKIDQFLNEAIEVRGKHGGLLVKVIETDDELDLEVADWTSFSGDASDLVHGVKVFTHHYTPERLLEIAEERGWDRDACVEAIELYAAADQDDELKSQRKTTGKYIAVREVSGVLSKQYLDEEADEHDYSYQLHYVAGAEFCSGKESDNAEERGVTLSGVELKESPYYYLPYKKRTTRGKELGIGQTERAKHAQVHTNIAAQQNKYALDFSSTFVLQSASKNLKGKNVLTKMQKGTILKTDDGKPISGVDMTPQALGHLGAYMVQWQEQLDRAAGVYAVNTGETLPSGTPYSLGQMLNSQAQLPFGLRQEEFANFLNQIYRERVIPFFIKQIKKKESLSLKFDPEELKRFDEDVTTYQADRVVIEKYLSGGYDDVPPAMRFTIMDDERADLIERYSFNLKKGKNRREVSGFQEGYWDEVKDGVYVDIVGERRNKTAILQTVNTVLMQYLQFKPQLDADPEARKLFNQIVQTAGLEPINFTETAPVDPMAMAGQQQLQAPQMPKVPEMPVM
jgi:hypothetical protein